MWHPRPPLFLYDLYVSAFIWSTNLWRTQKNWRKKPRSWIKSKGRAKSPLTGARHLSINGSYLIYPILGKGHYLISVIFDKPRICLIQCLSDRSSFNREIITKLVPLNLTTNRWFGVQPRFVSKPFSTLPIVVLSSKYGLIKI